MILVQNDEKHAKIFDIDRVKVDEKNSNKTNDISNKSVMFILIINSDILFKHLND